LNEQYLQPDRPVNRTIFGSFFIPFVLCRCRLAGPNRPASWRATLKILVFPCLAFGFGVRSENVRILPNLI
jgi:hypothetical protein